MKTVAIFVLVALVAFASAKQLVALQASQAEIKKLPVKVHLVAEDLSLVVAEDADLAKLQADYFSVPLGKFNPDRLIVVLEKQTIVSDTVLTLAAWRRELEATIRSNPKLTLLLVLPRRIVVEIQSGDIATLKDVKLSGDTEILPMLAKPVAAPRKNNAERLRAIRKQVRTTRHRADIPNLVNQVNQTVLRNFVEYLSGEASGSPILTRNAYSIGSGVQLAADYLQQAYRNSGFTATQEIFRSDMGPNVIAIRRGDIEPDTYVIIGAHYDSRGSQSASTTQRAPGANDDGSGTGALLQIAKIISDNNIRFRYSVILGSWCGEEQGLIGSRAYAQKSADADLDILSMLQADMIAYRVPSEAYQIAFPERYDDKDLTALAIDVVNTYVPNLRTCYTPACCSDHQSFTEQGYAATQFFERCGSIADNRYHDSGDLVNRSGYDLLALQYSTQALLANLLVLADAL